MSAVIFTDTCLLVNFEIIGELELLEETIMRSAQWTHEVHQEVVNMANTYQGLQTVSDFMPEPIQPTAAEMILTRTIREAMTGPGEPLTKNMGEAQTMAVVESRYPMSGVLVATEDKGVLTYINQLNARRKQEGLTAKVQVLTTRKVLALGRKLGKLTEEEMRQHLSTLIANSRGIMPEDV